MKAFINAVGDSDSVGNDRLSEARGLLCFGGKAVIGHMIDKLSACGVVSPVLLYSNPAHFFCTKNSLKVLVV